MNVFLQHRLSGNVYLCGSRYNVGIPEEDKSLSPAVKNKKLYN